MKEILFLVGNTTFTLEDLFGHYTPAFDIPQVGEHFTVTSKDKNNPIRGRFNNALYIVTNILHKYTLEDNQVNKKILIYLKKVNTSYRYLKN